MLPSINRKRLLVSVLFCVVFYAVLIEPCWIRLKVIRITDQPFSHFFSTYKTVLLSDIHTSLLGLRERLLLNKLKKISPDVIFLVGDYVSWSMNYGRTFDFLSKLEATSGVFGVLGDSDYQSSLRSCGFCHSFVPNSKDLPVRFLRDETIFLPAGKYRIAIRGVENFQNDLSKSEKILNGNHGWPEILLSHKQIELKELPDRPVLVLSGDTHGGQVYMPDWIWKLFFSQNKGTIRTGLIKKGNNLFFVTSGVGTNRLPIRLFCPPEIILFESQ